MKKILFGLFAVAMLAACSKDNDSGTPNNNSSETTIATQLSSGTWDVHYFVYNTDQTKAYSNYSFVFKKDSTLIVTDLGKSFNGGWYTTKRLDGSVQVSITIASLTSIQLLNNDWKVAANSGTLITLKDYENDNNAELHLKKR
ncbi:MAG: membrane lipoprotein lipid attachment site-containing protein [Gemmatimonadaceae bacterium]|nr:membrane lipoprotein lipid attachment site-containing protein [Chitinophagaceae bacterium]